MAKTVKAKQFQPSKSAESDFYRQLKKVAKASSHIVESHVDGHKITNPREMQKALEGYSKLIEPWAARQSAKMLGQIGKRNETAWKKNSKVIAAALKTGVAEQTTGLTALTLMREQVGLIKSIPTEAGLRAQKLATEAFFNGTRADEIADELARTNEVTESRAMLIARTEVARSNASINQARAISVGSRNYIWRNSGDGAVREAHKKYHGKNLDGMMFSWDAPPTLDDGTTGHPGTFPNCRCYAEAVFDDE